MLTLHVKAQELFDERNNTFLMFPEMELKLEHSLISLSRWESKWKKPFLNLEAPTKEELADYICCMSVDKAIDRKFAESMPTQDYIKIKEYIADSQTATVITDRSPKRKGKKEIYTSEVIYYWMIYYGIPFSCEKWPLNRLLTLIRVCGIKGGTSTQMMDMNAIFAQNTALNAARKARRMNG